MRQICPELYPERTTLTAAAYYPNVDRATVSLPQQAAWNWGWVSAVDARGQTIWIADAHRSGGKRFVVRADEKLTAFIEMEAAMRGCALHMRQESQPQPLAIEIVNAREIGTTEKVLTIRRDDSGKMSGAAVTPVNWKRVCFIGRAV